MDKREFIDRVKSERERWDELLAQVPDDLILRPGVEGDWSAKDILAHAMWYEREMIGMLKARALVGSDWWALPLDERNAAVHGEVSGMSLEEVRSEVAWVFPALVQQLEMLPEGALDDPAHFEGMPAEWAPSDVIGSNTFRHYPEHTESIRRLIGLDVSP